MQFNIEFLKKNQILIGVISGAVVLVVIVGVALLISQKGKPADVNNPANVQEEVKKTVAEVSKLIELPTAEDPTIATVTDVDKLRAQPFFQNAQNGDKVLIYQGAKKAILYRPSTKRVIEVSPINIGSPSAQLASPSPASAKPSATPK